MTTRTTNSRERNEEVAKTSRRHERFNQRDGTRVSTTTISFTAAGPSIDDSGNGLGSFSVGDRIRVEGTADNNGVFTVNSVAAGSLGTDETVVNESAGNAVVVQKVPG